MANYSGISVHDLIHKPGYQLDWLFGEAIIDMLDECGVPSTAEPLLDKLPGSAVWNLWGVGIDFFLQLKKDKVFDREKTIELIMGYSYLAGKYRLCDMVVFQSFIFLVCLKLMVGYYPIFIHEFALDDGYQVELEFTKLMVFVFLKNVDSRDSSQLFMKRGSITPYVLMLLWMQLGVIQKMRRHINGVVQCLVQCVKNIFGYIYKFVLNRVLFSKIN